MLRFRKAQQHNLTWFVPRYISDGTKFEMMRRLRSSYKSAYGGSWTNARGYARHGQPKVRRLHLLRNRRKTNFDRRRPQGSRILLQANATIASGPAQHRSDGRRVWKGG